MSHCQYTKLKSNGLSQHPCFNSIVFVDRFGKGFCAKHSYCGVKPLQLAAEFELAPKQPVARFIENFARSVAERRELSNPSKPESSSNIEQNYPKTYIDLTSTESVCERFQFPYQNLGELVEHHSVYLPKSKIKGCEWRMLSMPVQGEINGLPMFRGFALATNGVHVAIETSTGALIFGHVEWFNIDPKDRSKAEEQLLILPASKVDKQISKLEELFNT